MLFYQCRMFKRYSKVGYDYGTSIESCLEDDDEEDVQTGKGHTLSTVYIAKQPVAEDESKIPDSDNHDEVTSET